MEACCALAVNPFAEGRVLYTGDNFFVCAGLGAMEIRGYLLIVSREHFEGTGDMPAELNGELEEMMGLARARTYEQYGKKATIFEHGPRVGMCGWGGCIDHLHLHVVPGVDFTNRFAVDMMTQLKEPEQFYRVDRTTGFRRAQIIYEGGKTSYVMVETPAGERLVSEVGFPGPRQWLRRLTAQEVGFHEWNWRINPDRETAMKTVADLQGKF